MAHAAVGAIIMSARTGRVMLNLRSDSVTYSNYWGFVGGKIEDGEDVEVALHREIFEELGILLPVNVPKYQIDIFTTRNQKFNYYSYLVIVPEEFVPVLNSESKGYSWVEFGSWPKPLHPGAKSTLTNEDIIKKIQNLK